MDFGQAFGGIVPGARGAVLAVLLRTGGTLTGPRVHALIGGKHSLSAVQQALHDLEHLGLVTTETVGRAGVHRINEQHEAIAHLRPLRSPLDMLKHIVADTVTDARAVVVFGSPAVKRTATATSTSWSSPMPTGTEGRTSYERCTNDSGNDCDVLHLTPAEVTSRPDDREPVVAEILRDGVTLIGELPRRSRKAAS